VTDVSSSEDSSDEDYIAGVALTDFESPLPPPPMCLMAKSNSKVSDGESDDELNPNKFSNLIHEYTCIIKREKGKVKKLQSAHDSLESFHNNLLVKYNALLKEHDESLVLFKQVSDQYDKLKFDHVELRKKYNYLELAYEPLEDYLEQTSKIESTKIVKVDASTFCDDLTNELIYITIEKSATNLSLENASCSTKGKKEWNHLERLEREHKSLIRLYHLCEEQIVELEIREMELMKQVESIESSMKKLTRGEHKYKKMLFHHARDCGKRGLGSFPEINKGTIPSSEIKPSFVKNISSYCQYYQVTGHHTKECPLPTISKNSTMLKISIFS
jgi:hemerythrin-like domain-containing protein